MYYTAVVILNYNNIEYTINCVKSIAEYNSAPIKYLIVDNGSTLETAVKDLDSFLSRTFREKYKLLSENDYQPTLPLVTLIVSKTNDGYAKGNNKGLEFVYRDPSIKNILILNNDILFVEDIIPQLNEIYYSLPDVAILSPILYKSNLTDIDYNCARKNTTICNEIFNNLFHYLFKLLHVENAWKSRYLINNDIMLSSIIPIELPSGSCMFVDKDYFREIGSFDPNTFLYWEENILYKKIERTQRRNYLATNLKCIHLGASTSKSQQSLFILDCTQQSSLYYMNHYSGYSKLLCKIYRFSQLFDRQLFLLHSRVHKGTD